MPSVIPSFFVKDTATTETYTLSLHDALPICHLSRAHSGGSQRLGRHFAFDDRSHQSRSAVAAPRPARTRNVEPQDRKSTRLNSSHGYISYAVFCLKKKKHSDVRCPVSGVMFQ